MMAIVKRLWAEEEGQGMAEYGLLLAGIAVVVMVAVLALGNQIRQVFEGVISVLAGNSNNSNP